MGGPTSPAILFLRERGLTATEVGKASGASIETVSHVFNGRRHRDSDLARAVKRTLIERLGNQDAEELWNLIPEAPEERPRPRLSVGFSEEHIVSVLQSVSAQVRGFSIGIEQFHGTKTAAIRQAQDELLESVRDLRKAVKSIEQGRQHEQHFG